MKKIIVLSTQAAKQLAEQSTAKPGKFLKLAQKAFASKETSAALRTKIFSSDLYRSSRIFRSFQGMVFVFSPEDSCVKLDTVVHPQELAAHAGRAFV